MNIFGKIALTGFALSLSLVAVAAPAPASISGSTDFRVTLPEVLVLYHWDDAHLILQDVVTTTAANDSDAREISDNSTRNLTDDLGKSAYAITGDVNTTIPSTFLNSASTNVTLKNAWAVRSISTNNVTLGLLVQQPTLKNVNRAASVIEVGGAKLNSTGAGVSGSGTSTMKIPSGWQGVQGDINFTLDLTNANSSGEYNTRGLASLAAETDNGTDTFLLTLTGN